jgi:hypothetical protein
MNQTKMNRASESQPINQNTKRIEKRRAASEMRMYMYVETPRRACQVRRTLTRHDASRVSMLARTPSGVIGIVLGREDRRENLRTVHGGQLNMTGPRSRLSPGRWRWLSFGGKQEPPLRTNARTNAQGPMRRWLLLQRGKERKQTH